MPIFMKYDGVDGIVSGSADHFDFSDVGGGHEVQSLSLSYAKIDFHHTPMDDRGEAEWMPVTDIDDGSSNTMEF